MLNKRRASAWEKSGRLEIVGGIPRSNEEDADEEGMSDPAGDVVVCEFVSASDDDAVGGGAVSFEVAGLSDVLLAPAVVGAEVCDGGGEVVAVVLPLDAAGDVGVCEFVCVSDDDTVVGEAVSVEVIVLSDVLLAPVDVGAEVCDGGGGVVAVVPLLDAAGDVGVCEFVCVSDDDAVVGGVVSVEVIVLSDVLLAPVDVGAEVCDGGGEVVAVVPLVDAADDDVGVCEFVCVSDVEFALSFATFEGIFEFCSPSLPFNAIVSLSAAFTCFASAPFTAFISSPLVSVPLVSALKSCAIGFLSCPPNAQDVSRNTSSAP
ncbi:unnamed protein product [Taenia asiatica]|uniref:Uncharacterized protein n=1 Tax=Taenia asiatica TaxID=60517 RepID=A0A0R3W1X3_TAEAS|nr:unnamed protein product [Taenia asiatica]